MLVLTSSQVCLGVVDVAKIFMIKFYITVTVYVTV